MSGYFLATRSSRSFISVFLTSSGETYVSAGEPLDQRTLDGELATLAGQVCRNEERFSTARRDGHEAVEHDVVPDGPGREHGTMNATTRSADATSAFEKPRSPP